LEYYFTPKQYISPGSLTIVDDEAKHVARVMRKKAGVELFVTDGEGNLYKSKITNVTKEIIDCDIIEKFKNLNEPAIKITLYQSLIKNPDRFEFVIEKAVELGVHAIQPVVSENVINKTTNKTERWQSIALSAMKQSQRCYLPRVMEPVLYSSVTGTISRGLKLIAHEKPGGSTFLLNKGISETEISLFIGPEGGFTDGEIDLALKNGFNVLNLGARKYRSETAALLSIGLLLNN
jgi:16S rRNA (uracil1498-N3)-methyltransferase